MNIKKCTWVRKFCVTAFAVAMAATLLPAQAGLVKAAENQERKEEPAEHEHNYEDGEVSYVWADDYSTCTASVTCSVEGCDEKLEETADANYASDNNDDEQIFYVYAVFKNPLFELQEKKIDSLTGKIEGSFGYISYFSLADLYENGGLTEGEIKDFPNGSKKINFTLKSEEKDPEEDAKTAIDSLAKEKGLTVEKYLDLTLSKKVDNNDATEVTSLSGDMQISMNVSDFLSSDSGVTREFTVLRYHNNKAEALTTEAWNDDYGMTYISFYTDGFSAYALAYKDVSNAPAPAPANNSSNTSNSSSTSVSSTASNTSAETTAAAQVDAAQLTSPKTGDSLEPVALFAILLASCTGLLGCLAMKKRRA